MCLVHKFSFLGFRVLFFSFIYLVCVDVHTCVCMAFVWDKKTALWALVLSFYHVGRRGQTQVLGLAA